MNDKTLSIIVNNYNNKSFLPTCLNSILRQTRRPNEIVVVDDCSMDGSQDLLKEFASEHHEIKLILQEKRGGIRQSRNTGLSAATGEYVSFIDSDDHYYKDTALEDMLKISNDSTVGFGHFIRMNEAGKKLYQYKGKPKNFSKKHHSIPFLVSCFDMRTFPRNYVIQKKLFLRTGGYDFPFDYNEDVDMTLKLLKLGVLFKNVGYSTSAYVDTRKGLSRGSKSLYKPSIKELKKRYIKTASFFDRFYYFLLILATPIKKTAVFFYHQKLKFINKHQK
jgi:glycosyltransferase involved in cell wall biosynthesis